MTDASRWEAEARRILTNLGLKFLPVDVETFALTFSRIAAESRAEAIEECAKVCLEVAPGAIAGIMRAEAIRALKDARKP